jgi:peptidylprolyl isomerase/peptidyl-prolyl cis-trans isomerase D
MGTMNKLRENTGVVLWILVIAFGVVWVLQDSGTFDNIGAQTRNIAVVNGEPITYQEFQNTLQRQQQQVRSRSGGEVTPQMQDMIRDQTFNSLVNNRLLQQEMDRLGITVTDDEVMDMVYGENPDPFIRQQFSDSTGQLNRQLIRNLAQNPEARQSWIQIEQYLRNKRRSEKMSSLIGATVHVSEEDVLDTYRRRNTTANVRYVARRYAIIPDDSVTVNEQDLRNYYNENQEDFRRNRTYSVEYVTLSKAPTAEDTAQVVEDLNQLRDEFAAADNDSLFLAENASRRDFTGSFSSADELEGPIADALYPNPEPGDIVGPVAAANAAHLVKVVDTRPAEAPVVHARHILIRAPEPSAEQQQRAQELKERAESGEDFAALAREYSDDTGSATQGGDLGWFGRDRMVDPFAEAAFNASSGEIVGPVRTQFGYHVIEVLSRADEEVIIADMAYNLTPSQATLSDLEYTLDDLAYYASESGSFGEEAEEQGLNVQQVDVEADQQNIPGIGQSPEAASFLDDAGEGDISDVIETSERFVVLHVNAVRPEGYRSFEEVRAELEPRVRLQKKRDILTRRMEQALSNDDLAEMAEALGTTVRTRSDVTFQTNVVEGLGREPAFAGTVFGLEAGETSRIVAGENAAFVVRVTEFNEPAPITESEREQIRNELLQQQRQQVNSQWIASLREKSDIEDNRSEFQ